ncbi:MAG: hypothetical protein ABF310_08055 [Paracoccaceae bacterium]
MSRYHKLYLSTEVIRLMAPTPPHDTIQEFVIREDGSDLVSQMRALAAVIQEHDSEGRCDIWLPRDQVRILSAPHPTQTLTIEHVEHILAGATPYDLEDLIYTYAVESATVWICAVAQVTLSEAQSFTEKFDLKVQHIGAQPGLGHYPGAIQFWPHVAVPSDAAPAPAAPPVAAKISWLLPTVASLFLALGGWLLYEFMSAPDDPELMADAALYDDNGLEIEPIQVSEPPAPTNSGLDALRNSVVASALDQEQPSPPQTISPAPIAPQAEQTDELIGEPVTPQEGDQALDPSEGQIMDPLSLVDVTQAWAADLKEPLFDITQISANSDIYAASIDQNIQAQPPTALSPQSEVFLDQGHRSLPIPTPAQYQRAIAIIEAPEPQSSNIAPPEGQTVEVVDTEVQTSDAQALDIETTDAEPPRAERAATENTDTEVTRPTIPDTNITQSDETELAQALIEGIDTQPPQSEDTTDPEPQVPTPLVQLSPQAEQGFLIPMVRPADFALQIGEPAKITAPRFRPDDFSILPPERQPERVTMVQPKLRPSELDAQIASRNSQNQTERNTENTGVNAGGTALAMFETVDMTPPKLRPSGFKTSVTAIKRNDTAASNVKARITTRTAARPRSGASAAGNAATQSGGIRLNKDSLIGIYGTKSRKSALMRTSRGRYVKLKVGDRFDGGKVAAIGNRELRLVKGSRNVVYELP